MKKLARALAGLALGVALMFLVLDLGAALAEPGPGGTVQIAPMHDAGAPAPSSATLPPRADQLPNPATSPQAAWDDVTAARKTSWPLLIWASLAMLGKLLAYGRDRFKGWPVLGAAAAWLAVGKRAMAVAALGAIGSAGYDVLIAGGTWVAALVASGVALAGVTHSTTRGSPAPTGGVINASLLVLCAGAVTFALVMSAGCGGLRAGAEQVADDIVDCGKAEAMEQLAAYGPAMAGVVLAAVDNRGKLDKEQLRPVASALETGAQRCVLAAAISEVARRFAPNPDAPQSEGLTVDGDAARAAFGELAEELYGGQRFAVAGGVM